MRKANEKRFSCDFCNNEHVIPENNFPSNKIAQKMLHINLDRLDRGEAYKNARISFDIFNSKLESLEVINKDPGYFIDEYFSELINDVDLRREELKLEVDNYCDQIITDLEHSKIQCIENVSKQKVSSEELSYFKSVSELFKKDFKMLDLDEQRWKAIEMKSKILINKIDHEIKEMKTYLLMNKLYEFKAPEVLFDPKNVCDLEIRNVDSLMNIADEINDLKTSIKHKIETGRRKKYRLKDYEKLKTWNDLNSDEQEKLRESFSPPFLEQILTNCDQCEHLKFINEIEKNPKNIKKYTVISKHDLNQDSCWRYFIIFKHLNPSYQHEFLNNFGFVVLIKDAKYERI